MSEDRDFIYCRKDPVPADPAVSQGPTSSDLAVIRARLKGARQEGFDVHKQDVIIENVTAAVAASGRPKFTKLLRGLEPHDGLIVWRLDELGHNAADILKTIRKVADRGAEVYCLEASLDQLPSAEQIMSTLKALAKLDQSAARTKRAGRTRVGRPPSLDQEARSKVQAGLAAGETVTDLARRFNTTRQTIMRTRSTKG